MPFHQDGPEGYPLTPPPTPPDDEYQPEGLSTFLPADSTGSFLTNWLSATEVERPARGYRLQPGRPSYNSAPPKLDSSLSPQSVDSGRRRPALRDYHTGSSGRSRGSIRSPDRFLPPRDFSDAVVQKFHANKHPQQLSPAEKLLRHDEATPDAFGPRRIATSQSPIRSVVRRRASGIASRPGGPSALTLQRDAHPTVGQRQVSVGSIWAVGGVAPLSVGVPNGRGRLISSGTNAPLYSSSFSDSTPKAEVEREKHEGRIAQALDLDRAQRIYDVADPKLSPSTICKRKRRNVDLGVKTIWSGSEWVLEGQRPSEYPIPHLPFTSLTH
ncbi:MAG: hypothetical protein M1818_005746 [Claussenomyces sp. TS43310]|nr:MAG: hypothetical protein M1818_005746 [Claussenomyces sp. TS43310]